MAESSNGYGVDKTGFKEIRSQNSYIFMTPRKKRSWLQSGPKWLHSNTASDYSVVAR